MYASFSINAKAVVSRVAPGFLSNPPRVIRYPHKAPGRPKAVVEMLGLDLTSHDWKLKPISPRPMATTAQIMCRKVCSRCHVEMSDSTVDSLCSGKKK